MTQKSPQRADGCSFPGATQTYPHTEGNSRAWPSQHKKPQLQHETGQCASGPAPLVPDTARGRRRGLDEGAVLLAVPASQPNTDRIFLTLSTSVV